MNKENYQSPPVGQEISCVMNGIAKELLSDNENLKQIFEGSLNKNNFSVLKKIYHVFSPQGFTALILLSESHLAIHTYPERNSLYFNMYSCRGPEDAKPIFDFVKEKLKPQKILFYKENKIPVVN